MSTHFHYVSVVEDDNEVGMSDGAESVGDDEASAVLHELAERLLNKLFALRIEVAGGFIEDEDFGICEDGACDGESLALPSAEFDTPFTDDGVVAVGESADEFVGVGLNGGLFDFVGIDLTTGVGDILGDCAVKEEDILFDDSQEAAVVVEFNGGQVDSIEEDPTMSRIVKAGDEIAESCFTGAGVADERDGLTVFDFNIDGLKSPGMFRGITERDILEGEITLDEMRSEGDGGAGI